MTERVCVSCGDPLLGRKKRYCSGPCSKRAGRETHLMKCFGITTKQYDAILKEQNGSCAVCRKPPKAGKSLAVDHAHVSGRSGPVRGLLCFFCNKRVLGARSDEAILRLAEYVSSPPALRAGVDVIAPGRPMKKRRLRKRKRS